MNPRPGELDLFRPGDPLNPTGMKEPIMRQTVRSIAVTTAGGEVLHLAVPPMHEHTPSWIRVRIFEYVLRRQIGLAQMLAQGAEDDATGTSPELARLQAMLQETPHRNTRWAAAA